MPIAIPQVWCAALVLVVASSEDERVSAGGMASPGVRSIERLGGCNARWVPTFGGWAGVDQPVWDLAVFDDGLGDGPQLFVGGAFRRAGDVDALHVARWNGISWAPVGSGLGPAPSGVVRALGVHDDGRGPALYAGGFFEGGNVARWDGREWTFLPGLSGSVWAFATFDDGNGPALIGGGDFPDGNIAKWNGTEWTPLGSGVAGPTGVAFAPITSLAVFDDGQGPALFAGGGFDSAGGAPARNIARWDGTGWSSLTSGLDRGVSDLEVFDDGSGAALFVAGYFQTAGGMSMPNVARWTGAGWYRAGDASGVVHSLGIFDDGDGAALYGTGFGFALERWDGEQWVTEFDRINRVDAMVSFDDGRGGGPELYLGGVFTHQGDGVNTIVSRGIGKWNGARWAALANSVDRQVDALEFFDSGRGRALVVAGHFEHAGERTVGHVAEWDGTSWEPLGEGTDAPVAALAVFDDRSRGGLGLVAGGSFTSAGKRPASNIARWDGREWSSLGSGVDGSVSALLAHEEDGRPVLTVGGSFQQAGGLTVNRIARWDGREWASLGTGFDAPVLALALFDDGGPGGPRVYAGGEFRNAGGVRTDFVARWNGSAWEPVGLTGGMNARVCVLTAFDGGSQGRGLIAGGDFTTAGSASASRIARWNGGSWAALAGGGMNDTVRALRVFDEGRGNPPVLLVGGDFALVGGASLGHLVSWNGQRFSRFAQWTGGDVYALTSRESTATAGPEVFVGGTFPVGQPSGDSFLARYRRCPDDTPPRLICPASLEVDDSPADGTGEIVTFTIHAVDDLDAHPAVVCNPPSGSLFPPGETWVECKVTDGSGNTTACAFPVRVWPAGRRSVPHAR